MRYLILLILILFLISGEVYAEKTTCRSIQKNPFHEIVTVTTFWGHYRGYIFGKTGEILDMEKNKIMERIPDYIKKKCKINKRIDVFNELIFQGIKDEFQVKWEKILKEKLTIESFLIRVEKEFKKDKVRKCAIENLNIDTIKLIEEKLPELEKLRKRSGRERYGNSIIKKVFGKNDDGLLNYNNLEKKCGQYM